MRIALTGTPGTGKTTVAPLIAEALGLEVVDLKEFAIDNDCVVDFDEEDDAHVIDVDELEDKLHGTQDVVIEGHLAHLLYVNAIIVLRTHPRVLMERLRARGYDNRKIKENLEAEILDILFQEALEETPNVIHIDATAMSPEEVARVAVEALRKTPPVLESKIDWSELAMELDSWF